MESPLRRITILGIAIGLVISGCEKQSPRSTETPPENKSPDSDNATWRTQHFSGLSLSLPFDLGDEESSLDQLPPNIQEAAKSAVLCKNRTDQIGISVTTVNLKDGASIDLKVAAKGVVHRVARKLEEAGLEPFFLTFPKKKDGCEWLDVSYVPKSRRFHLDAALIRKGDTYWQVLIMDVTKLNGDKKDWILDSIKL